MSNVGKPLRHLVPLQSTNLLTAMREDMSALLVEKDSKDRIICECIRLLPVCVDWLNSLLTFNIAPDPGEILPFVVIKFVP